MQNCANVQANAEFGKLCKIVQYVQTCTNWAKLCKMCKLVQANVRIICQIMQNVQKNAICAKYYKELGYV